MGVTLWLPRQVLPGAAPSPVWRWQELEPATPFGLNPAVRASVSDVAVNIDTDSTGSLNRAAAGRRPDTNKAPLRQLLQGVTTAVIASQSDAVSSPVSQPTGASASSRSLDTELERQAGNNVVAVKPIATTEPQAATIPEVAAQITATATPRFRLAMISYSDCLVVTELPTSQNLPWSDQHQQLLNAIIKAVGLGGDSQVVAGMREFFWPLDPLARFDQSAPIARHALQVELAGVQQVSHRALLLMGAKAAEFLLSCEEDAMLGQWIDHQGLPTLFCHGLNEVLRLSGLKAELWRQLQPLRSLADGR